MMRFLTTVVAGAIVGALGVYFTMDWQEEKLGFSITAPARFGDIHYQNIILVNDGWNPAVNVKLYIDHPAIRFDNVKSAVALADISGETNGIASIERVRRDESVVFSMAYTGRPLLGTEVRIVSDRSIAELRDAPTDAELPVWAAIVIWVLGSFFAIGLVSSIAIPAYQDYVKRAKEAMSG
jgi:hypothetical protein